MAHFLKRLELNGFKSFAGKTVLEFPAGIVAVVGPNGSGKSNIVDALRWLLGERDAKNLRGAKIDDLIFAGTEKRARTGVATASLHFENKNKFFPVDFEEVAVSREIRRDGQSKYFLNKSEVLLRDLVDFFAKARLGSRGLVIIGQGDSDLFIRSSPLERREMIEEILGLREYQFKKADAERRLKNSRINLDKVRALIEEILPHLRSLKRQTNRWERRGAVEEELRNLENRFFGSQLRELHAKTAAVEEKIATHKKQFEALEADKRNAEARQAKIEAGQPEEKKDLAKLKDEIRALLEKRNALQKDFGRLEVQIEITQSSTVSGSGHTIEKLLSLIKKIKNELTGVVGGGIVEIRVAVEAVIEHIDTILEEKPAEQAKDIPPALAANLQKIQNDLKELDLQLSELREKENAFEKNQEGFYALFKSAVAEVQAANHSIDAWHREHREYIAEKERFDFRRDELVRQIEQAGRRVDEFGQESVSQFVPEQGDAPSAEMSFEEMERKLFRMRGELASIGEVDEALMREAKETESRYEFLLKESEDLEKAVGDLTALMWELTEKIKTEFEKSLHTINVEFDKFFQLMFGGGSARLRILKPKIEKPAAEDGEMIEGESSETGDIDDAMAEDEHVLPEKEGGVEVEVKLPRKKTTSLDILSGGERSLVGIAALFALVSVSPPPFLVLDEIDAPLDERNARRFGEMLREFSKRTQFIVVTHNRATMEAAEVLYGVTLGEDGASKIVSLKLESEPVEAKV